MAMPLLDPTVAFKLGTEVYEGPLRMFNKLLEENELDDLPAPIDPLPGPIFAVTISNPAYLYRGVLSLPDGDPFQYSMLKYELNRLLLIHVFGLEEDSQEWNRTEQVLYEKLWL